jgi:excisionase family DNA binding protein
MNYFNQISQFERPPGLTPAQLARKLGVKRSTVYAWISRGEMRANKVGSSRFITQQQLDDFYLQRSTGEYVDMTYANGPVRN